MPGAQETLSHAPRHLDLDLGLGLGSRSIDMMENRVLAKLRAENT